MPPLKRAAMYVRMSSEHQQYSMAEQADAIRRYAAERGLVIVKSFADAAKSGLTLAKRVGLRQLLLDVISGSPGFTDVLVYDVSRWGRFQDTDESAFYEYTCKREGVRVHYCLEQFENDGAPYSTLIKALKRAMAAEYSRELSAKVFAGHARLTVLGYRQGGSAGFGLRRILLDSEGKKRAVLKSGDAKSVQTDRVVLAPGPVQEVRVVRQIFRWYVQEGKSEQVIADLLNAQHIELQAETRWPAPRWTIRRVNNILTGPKYTGANTYNRTSCKLKQPMTRNPAEDWISLSNAFPEIIPKTVYDQAQDARKTRAEHLSNDQIVEQLRALFKREGKLSTKIINSDPGSPCATTVWERFGSLKVAYRLAGYK